MRPVSKIEAKFQTLHPVKIRVQPKSDPSSDIFLPGAPLRSLGGRISNVEKSTAVKHKIARLSSWWPTPIPGSTAVSLK